MSVLTLNITIPSVQGLMQPGADSGFSTGNNANAGLGQQPFDKQTIEQMAQLLGELLKPLLSPQAGNAATGANGEGQLAGVGNAGGPSEQNGALGATPQNNGQNALSEMGNNGLDQALTPDGQGGGQISDNPLLKALLKLIARMMDGQSDPLGQQGAGSHNASSGTSSTGSSPSNDLSGNGFPSGPSSGGTAPTHSDSPPSTPTSPTSPLDFPSSPTGGAGGSTPVTDRPDPVGSSGVGAGQAVDFPGASANPTVVHDTITVKAGQVFDGKGQTFTAGSELGDGGQSESQKPLFKLEDGASLKNVTIGNNGADGIHLYGDAKIDNLHVTNVGEDAITVKPNGAGKKSHVEITNSTFQNASDKILQLNADTSLTVDNVKAKDFGTFVRTNGGQQGNWDLNLSHISAQNGKFSFVKSDSEGLNVNTQDISLDNVQNHYKVPASANLKVAE
ncbi:pectate lyase [Erwinia tasmaniensis]|uniref:pectate lyase n=1 Tax=Erwinia tasmaniensis (strain DSM 17950 / CFBP 7177 / CIP 109463 / NCPPB 4357 / Et1/99) TaxID=465817 RepID=B2VJH5_ERWT9|nr:pectate lyase [Erwinia tasmaniensis]CAO95587.1 HrpW protein (hrp cluster) [Erwinia tasmaniensis Et1/99]